jgi:hypothetical protein
MFIQFLPIIQFTLIFKLQFYYFILLFQTNEFGYLANRVSEKIAVAIAVIL